MPHRLIILTDSYINLFRILDILLGLVHLRTQRQLAGAQLADSNKRHQHELASPESKAQPERQQQQQLRDCAASSLLNCHCTYNFKRLPLLGSFVNCLFLTALLLSAAIEGIQTCLHVGHSQADNQETILTQNPLAYPLLLIGFAIVGVIMQFCSLRAHEMREEELCSESLLDVRACGELGAAVSASRSSESTGPPPSGPLELDARQLAAAEPSLGSNERKITLGKLTKSLLNLSTKRRSNHEFDLIAEQSSDSFGVPKSRHGASMRASSLELPDSFEANNIQRISLRSLDDSETKFYTIKLDDPPEDGQDLEAPKVGPPAGKQLAGERKFASHMHDKCFWLRALISPCALLCCATIILSGDSSWLTEISDATLALVVVVSLFAASYPPVRRAGRVLLQTAPTGVDLAKLGRDLKRSHGHIVEVRDLHVWSLTPRSNRVATCALVLDGRQVSSPAQVAHIMREANFVFRELNIKCTTIEPILASGTAMSESGAEHSGEHKG